MTKRRYRFIENSWQLLKTEMLCSCAPERRAGARKVIAGEPSHDRRARPEGGTVSCAQGDCRARADRRPTEEVDGYFDLRSRQGVKTFLQPDRLKSPPKGVSVYARNNLWMVNTARARVKKLGGRIAIINPTRLYASSRAHSVGSGTGRSGFAQSRADGRVHRPGRRRGGRRPVPPRRARAVVCPEPSGPYGGVDPGFPTYPSGIVKS